MWPTDRARGAFTCRVFGFDLASDEPVLGTNPPATGATPAVTLAVADRRRLLAGWPDDAVDVHTGRRADGRVVHRIATHPDAGWLLVSLGNGAFRIAPGGDHVDAAPVRRTPTWRWQRYLVGQVLPFVAVLRGLEVFHASGVCRAGRAVVLTGPSGAGKSTLAVTLRDRGWLAVADDVVAVDVTPEGIVRAHPGAGVANVRHGALPPPALDPVRAATVDGTRLGSDAVGSRVAVPVVTSPQPLAAVLVLDRGSAPTRIEALRPPDPRLLLAATFNLVVASPARLTRHLDVCARIAAAADVFRVVIGPDAGPEAVADLVEECVAA